MKEKEQGRNSKMGVCILGECRGGKRRRRVREKTEDATRLDWVREREERSVLPCVEKEEVK